MIKECKKAAWQELKNSDIFIYSAIFVVLTGVLPFLKNELSMFLSLSHTTIIYCIYITTTDIIFFILNVSFYYMIMYSKFKAKRFFSFFSPKHFKFNVLSALCIIVPHSVFTVLNVFFELENRKLPAFITLTLVLILGELYTFAAYFKALYPKDTLKETFRKLMHFIFRHLLKFILFRLSFILWNIGQIIAAKVFMVILNLEPLAYIADIAIATIYTPYYILSFKHFVKSFE